MKPIYHANAAARRYGGAPEDYLDIHDFLDSSKSAHPDVRHRAALHSTFAYGVCERVFGATVRNSDGAEFPVRGVVEDHLATDCAGRIPSPRDYLVNMVEQEWMRGDGLRRDALRHARASAREWGGAAEDYLEVHAFIDSPAEGWDDVRARAVLHHAFGTMVVERAFGRALRNSSGRVVPVRALAERHVKDDLGCLPSLGDWLHNMRIQPWMHGSDRPETPVGRRGRPRLRTIDDPVDHRTTNPSEEDA